MNHCHHQPGIGHANPRELILERLHGPTMLGDLARRPWLVRRHGQILAELHHRLHAVPASPGLRAPFGRGDSLAHFDLHPGNVLLTEHGPVVIDWRSASRGETADDVAVTWVILATSAIPGPLPFRALARAGRSRLVNAFLAAVDAEAASARVPEAAQRRIDTDPHLLERERRALQTLIAQIAPPLHRPR